MTIVLPKELQLEGEKEYHNRWIMTKPLPTGCIKRKKTIPDWCKFNLLVKKVSIEDKIEHSFIVDIKIDPNKAGEKELLLNKIYPPIFEKISC